MSYCIHWNLLGTCKAPCTYLLMLSCFWGELLCLALFCFSRASLCDAVNFLQIAVMAGEIWSHCAHTVFWLQVTWGKYIHSMLPHLVAYCFTFIFIRGTWSKFWHFITIKLFTRKSHDTYFRFITIFMLILWCYDDYNMFYLLRPLHPILWRDTKQIQPLIKRRG